MGHYDTLNLGYIPRYRASPFSRTTRGVATGGAWGAASPLASEAVGNFLNFVLLSANLETFCFRKYFVGNISRPIRKSTSLLQQRKRGVYKLFGFTQIISDATRVTLSTSTLIDHIATNNNSSISRSGVLKTTFSDHYMVFCARKFRGAFKKEHKYIVCRKMRKFNQAEFLMECY